ncbi:MAG: ABC transporter permease [Ruegeria sp.]
MPEAPPLPQSRPVSAGQLIHGRRFATGRTVLALILREMTSRYGRSPGGYLWAVLEPLGGIVILVLGFSLIIRSPPLGSSFMLFYATGFLPFNLYQSLAGTVSQSINFSKPLLRYPAVTWMDAVLARFILNALTGLLVIYLLLVGILALEKTRVSVEFAPIAQSLGLAMLLGLGIGTLNCALIGLFTVWGQIWSIITRPLFLAAGVFFLFEDLPRAVQDVLWYIPLVHVTGLIRTGFYPMYEAQYVSITYATAVGLITLFMGLVLLGRYHRDILNR